MSFLFTHTSKLLLNSLLIGHFITLFTGPVFFYFFMSGTTLNTLSFGELFSEYVLMLLQSFLFTLPFFLVYAISAVYLYNKAKTDDSIKLFFGLLALFLIAIMFFIDLGLSTWFQKQDVCISYMVVHFICLFLLRIPKS